MAKTKIEWSGKSWNPAAGCSLVSPGCTNCYAQRMASRCVAMGQHKYVGTVSKTKAGPVWTGQVNFDLDALRRPLGWRTGETIFVNSMSDLFHPSITDEQIRQVWGVMCLTPQHRFQILTKRPNRFSQICDELPWPDHIWLGVSVESAKYVDRIDDLRATPAKIKFLSLEPLLGPLPNLNLTGIDWVIAGGESGPRARKMHAGWVRDIRDQCIRWPTPFFFKQWGAFGEDGARRRKDLTGRHLDKRIWNEMPGFAHMQKAA